MKTSKKLCLNTVLLICASLVVGGCESYTRMAPPPPSPNFAPRFSLMTGDDISESTAAWQGLEAASIEPASGDSAAAVPGKESLTRRDCLQVGFRDGEALSYNWDGGRIGLALGGHDYGYGPDMGQATMRYTVSLQDKKSACD